MEEGGQEAKAVWDCGSPLYDSYELASIGHLIERHLMALPSLGGSKRFLSTQHSHASSVIPISALSTSNFRSTRKARGTSLVVFFTQLFRKKMWKRKEEENKEKPKYMADAESTSVRNKEKDRATEVQRRRKKMSKAKRKALQQGRACGSKKELWVLGTGES
ncbi:uncharacterized protein LOC131166688 [Malania oleifera]|uniref:uncharacterized protein LOC131166688 n=1 Tax=Malania oleifera TaxID=397392 RepID=UPI0025AE4431|nr:uncharacterized protein LOC131166688 [Malania oleifera]